MCLICVDFQKNKMTLGEARRALVEMVASLEPGHAQEVRDMLKKAEQESAKTQPAKPADPQKP